MRETEGNIWNYLGNAIIAITTNGSLAGNGDAVFGRGCARQALEHFPDLKRRLGGLIHDAGNHVHYLGDGIVSFPVEWTPWENPDLSLIARSARELRDLADRLGWSRVVVPRPGCGNGGLDWREVRPLLEAALDDRFLVITATGEEIGV